MLRLAPWVRAPLLLLTRPGVAVGLVAAAFVATLPAAAAPLFLSSARNASLNQQVTQSCQWSAGAHVAGQIGVASPTGAPTPLPDLIAYRKDKVTGLAPAGLEAPVHSLWMAAESANAGTRLGPTNVMARDGFAAHVELKAGGTGPGVWLPDRFAEQSNLKVGDPFTVLGFTRNGPDGERLPSVDAVVPVAAIYVDLRRRPFDPYWCAHRVLYEGEPGQEFTNRPIPPLVLVDEQTYLTTLLDVSVRNKRQDADFALVDPRLDVSRAATLARGLTAMNAELRRDPRTSLNLGFTANMPNYVPRTGLVRDSLVPPVVSITAAGVAVGLLVVAAAALFWVQRRRRELTVLAAHGVGPVPLGLKGLLEALPALILGAAAGWYAAVLLVRSVGPTPVLTDDARPRSLLTGGAALVAALVVMAVAAGARSRSLTDVVAPHRRLRLLAAPWELLLVAAGVLAWFALDDSRQATAEGFGVVAQVPAKLLVAPILVIIGTAAFAARLATRWMRYRATRPGSRRPALFIASRRLSREAPVAAMLAAATAIPIAFAAYGATVNGSVRATLGAEAGFMIGADVVVTLSEPAPVPGALAGKATPVLRVTGVIIGGIQTDVLVVDPATFGRAAAWDDRPIGMSHDHAMDVLRGGGIVGASPMRGGEQQGVYLGQPTPAWDVHPVRAMLASQGGYPTTLMSRDSAGDLADRGTPQLWLHGDPVELRRQVEAAGLPLSRIVVARDLYADTLFEALTYTFDYLAALSLLTGLITTVGLLLYLESRAPSHRRGYALLRRMRLRPGAHRAALALELTAPLVVGLVGGVALAGAIVSVLSDEFEINRVMPPGTVVTVPYAALAVTAASVALIALLAIVYAQRRVGRATPAEVLREVV